MKKICKAVCLSSILSLWAVGLSWADSRIDSRSLSSDKFEANTIGVSAIRNVRILLPEDYQTSGRRYPVIYYLSSFFEDESAFFDHHQGHIPFVKAMENGALDDVIIVSADFNTPVGGSLYTNSSVTGRWQDFMIEDLVPFIDREYRTLGQRNSRAIMGHHAGGYGAIRIASRHPETFGIVYGLHPVATGFGHTLMQSRPDWNKLDRVEDLSELKGDFLSEIFTAIYQANLPDPENPPLYFDPPARMDGDDLVLDAALTDKLQEGFFLERQIGDYAENLKSLIAFKFDWGRHDGNQDHVFSNHFYTRKLNEYGVPHEAEEYNGGWGDKTFDTGGRIETDVIPFLQQNLSWEMAR